ncbi:hypothetical protein [Rhodopirellula sallentina]|uniref:Secreted protein n=1 Tax=Rhodopirellula sallentina SM41 TaxID=1263870 RepID=M5UNE9_9BACT|nr:hypothetical protein [Rhodopirellula sallentina]EMI57533.1 secreted protein [Rhodopirellula sallentina SM41]
MKTLAILSLLVAGFAVTGCGSSEPAVIGASDPEGIANYEAIIAEQQMSQRNMKEVEKEIMKE